MKKVRIMLAAMIVLGSVGGALALKAKRFGSDSYCISTTTTLNGSPRCPLSRDENATFDNASGPISAYIPTANPAACTTVGAPLCEKLGHLAQ